jgi:hypothetical protein
MTEQARRPGEVLGGGDLAVWFSSSEAAAVLDLRRWAPDLLA